MNLTHEGKRDMVNLTIYKKIKEANVVTMTGLQREVAKVKKTVKTMRMGPAPGMNDEMKSFTEEEQRRHIKSTTSGVSFAIRREACHAITEGSKRRQ